MGYAIKQIDDEPIIVVTYSELWNPEADILAVAEAIAPMLDAIEGTVYRIDDLSYVNMDFGKLMIGMKVATSGPQGANHIGICGSMIDPQIRGVLVGTQQTVEIASQGMKHDVYGATQTPFFTSLEDGVAYARQSGSE